MAFCSSVKTYLHLVFLHPSVFLNRLPLGNTAAIIVTIITFFCCCCCCWKIVWVQGGTQNWNIQLLKSEDERAAGADRLHLLPKCFPPHLPGHHAAGAGSLVAAALKHLKQFMECTEKRTRAQNNSGERGGLGGHEQQQHGASETLKQTQRKSVFFSSSAHNIDLQAAVLLLTVNIAVYKNTTLPLLLNWILTNECYFSPAPHHHHPPSRTCL